jgi:hypothetical protein
MVRDVLTRKEPIMTPGEALVPAVIAIVFVVAWFVVGVIDATRDDPPVQRVEADRRAARAETHAHRR